MRCCGLLLPFLLTPLMATSAHAASTFGGGVITFQGMITRSTTPLSPTGAYSESRFSVSTMTLPLSRARVLLSSDVLNFFATYAHRDAKFVSVTYP
jgi:hypothetical protein